MAKFLAKILYYLFTLVNWTYRYRYTGMENIKKAQQMSQHGNYIFALWHQHLLQGNFAQRNVPHVVLVSRSKDGDLIAWTCGKLGFIPCRGSSMRAGVYKGGKEAKDEMISKMIEGYPGALTVDGPKGPAKEPKLGVVDMAKKTGHPIVPYIPVAESYWEFNSWDKFRLPKPFSRIIVYYGEPIQVPEDMEYDQFHQIKDQLRDSLIKGEEESYKLFNEQFKELPKCNYPKYFNETAYGS